MTRWKWILFALLLACLIGNPNRARAQSQESAVGGEEYLSVGGNINGTYVGYGERWLGGAGADVDIGINPWIGLEGESNFTFYHQFYSQHESTWLGGPRYTFHAMGSNYRFRPYAKGLIGVGYFNFFNNLGHGSYFVVAPGAGVDYRIDYHWRLRLADFEYQYWPEFTFGPTQNYAITTGIRYVIR
jgi:hypothetical protein